MQTVFKLLMPHNLGAEAGGSCASGSSGSIRCVALTLMVLGSTACFDVHQTELGSLLIDDFDHGAFPADPNFTPWMCFSYNPSTNQNYSCAFDADTLDGSAHSLRLDFTISDPPDGSEQFGGAGLVTYATAGLYQDFTRFGTLGFEAQLQSGVPQLPSNTILYVVLGCSTVELTDGSQPGDVYIEQSAVYEDSWKQGVLELQNFGFPDARKVQGGLASCLQRVDRVALQVSPELPDGAIGRGTLKIDDVYLQ
jgi:hypothetical protein